MDYKKIVASRSLRLKILRLLSFVPDSIMIRLQYYIKTGRRLNLKNPKRFTEKLQWYKLYYKNPMMIRCVDKYDARGYVEEKGLGEILLPLYGVYDSPDEINFENLPEQFVVKDALGGGGNAVIVVKNKFESNVDELKKQARGWLRVDARKKDAGREWPYYSGKQRRIVVEKYIESNDAGGLIDYKFFCFHGKVEFLYAMGNRRVGEKVCVSIYDRDFALLPVSRVGDDRFDQAVKPKNFDEMLKVAETLAADFPHVRVDLYNVDGVIYFGELTFYNASGYMKFDPDEYDFKFGELFTLEKYDAPKGKEVTYESCLSVTRKETESPRRSTGTERLTVEK